MNPQESYTPLRTAEEGLRVLASYPLEEFGVEAKPDRKLFGANDWGLYVRDVLAARDALAAQAVPAEGDAKPVAWRTRDARSGLWIYGPRDPNRPDFPNHPDEYLFAAAPRAAGQASAVGALVAKWREESGRPENMRIRTILRRCANNLEAALADAAPDCTEPNRAACPRMCMDFCNAVESGERLADAAPVGGRVPDGSMTVEDAVSAVADLFPGADKQALRVLARALTKKPSPAAPVAAEAEAVAGTWHFLKEGEVVLATDEFLSPDDCTWHRPVGWEVGIQYLSRVFNPCRRRIAATPKGQANNAEGE